MERYNAIERYHLEIMLGQLYESHGQIRDALVLYQSMDRRYGGLLFLEAYYPMDSQIRRLPLSQGLNEIHDKMKALQAELKEFRRKRRAGS